MPWLGSRKSWSNGKWDGHYYVDGGRQKEGQTEPEPLPELSIWQKLKGFFRNLYLKWRNSL